MSLLESFQPSEQPACRVWALDHQVHKIIFFYNITKHPDYYHSPLTKASWQLKVPFKVKVFVWTAILNQLNTNSQLQVCRPNWVLSPCICMTCCRRGEYTQLSIPSLSGGMEAMEKVMDTSNPPWTTSFPGMPYKFQYWRHRDKEESTMLWTRSVVRRSGQFGWKEITE